MTGGYRVALLGHGIGPSLTPAMHEQEATALGLDYRYEVVDLIDRPGVDLGAELSALEERGFVAVNVTHPFKQAVLAHVDHHSDAVDQIGAANLVLLGRGGRTAHNTDVTGFRAALEEFLGTDDRGTVVQVGAGGAGLATASSLVSMGFDRIVVHDLRPEPADRLVARFGDAAGDRIAGSDGDLARWSPRTSAWMSFGHSAIGSTRPFAPSRRPTMSRAATWSPSCSHRATMSRLPTAWCT